MTTFDFSPLFRTSIGYDRLAALLNSANRVEQNGGYPPYNIVSSGENQYRITMAVAGFSESELSITSEHNKLVVTGEKAEDEESEGAQFLYRGIATRSFERRFNLADPDIFEMVNFNRQIGATTATIGRRKTDVLGEAVHGVNPEADVRLFKSGITQDNIGRFGGLLGLL